MRIKRFSTASETVLSAVQQQLDQTHIRSIFFNPRPSEECPNDGRLATLLRPEFLRPPQRTAPRTIQSARSRLAHLHPSSFLLSFSTPLLMRFLFPRDAPHTRCARRMSRMAKKSSPCRLLNGLLRPELLTDARTCLRRDKKHR